MENGNNNRVVAMMVLAEQTDIVGVAVIIVEVGADCCDIFVNIIRCILMCIMESYPVVMMVTST